MARLLSALQWYSNLLYYYFANNAIVNVMSAWEARTTFFRRNINHISQLFHCKWQLTHGFSKGRTGCSILPASCRKHLLVWSWCDHRNKLPITSSDHFNKQVLYLREKRRLGDIIPTLSICHLPKRRDIHWDQPNFYIPGNVMQTTKIWGRSLFSRQDKPST